MVPSIDEIVEAAHRLGCENTTEHDSQRHYTMSKIYYKTLSRYKMDLGADELINAIMEVSNWSKDNPVWTHPHPFKVIKYLEEKMGVKFTQEAEVDRIAAEKKPSWELFSSSSLVKSLHEARRLGWEQKKVQVRVEILGTDMVNYIVEPFERDCNCPGILKYRDYFDPSPDPA